MGDRGTSKLKLSPTPKGVGCCYTGRSCHPVPGRQGIWAELRYDTGGLSATSKVKSAWTLSCNPAQDWLWMVHPLERRQACLRLDGRQVTPLALLCGGVYIYITAHRYILLDHVGARINREAWMCVQRLTRQKKLLKSLVYISCFTSLQ